MITNVTTDYQLTKVPWLQKLEVFQCLPLVQRLPRLPVLPVGSYGYAHAPEVLGSAGNFLSCFRTATKTIRI
jgi:hypothetical protein